MKIKHRNSIETWSKDGGEAFSRISNMYYDFTIAATQAFGNNMVLSGGKWCIYVKLLVFDLLSHEVAGLVDEQQTAGTYQVSFDASGLSSRVYFYRIQTEGFTDEKLMILVK